MQSLKRGPKRSASAPAIGSEAETSPAKRVRGKQAAPFAALRTSNAAPDIGPLPNGYAVCDISAQASKATPALQPSPTIPALTVSRRCLSRQSRKDAKPEGSPESWKVSQVDTSAGDSHSKTGQLVAKPKVTPRPDGRQCAFCPRCDDQPDPISKVNDDLPCFMRWAKPTHAQTGHTQGKVCGYCLSATVLLPTIVNGHWIHCIALQIHVCLQVLCQPCEKDYRRRRFDISSVRC